MQGNPTIIDIEASGFGAHSYPIEIGVALGNGQTACYLIRPQVEWTHWDQSSEHLHRLTREQILRHGRPLTEVARALNQLLGTHTVYSDAWGFDQTWLSLLFECAGVRQQFKLESLQSLFSEHQFTMWNRVLEQVFAECEVPRHRASNDARAIQLAFARSAEFASTC
jgi:hypothetical protein